MAVSRCENSEDDTDGGCVRGGGDAGSGGGCGGG